MAELILRLEFPRGKRTSVWTFGVTFVDMGEFLDQHGRETLVLRLRNTLLLMT